MGKIKYMPSNGLAFSEQKDMEKLAKKAKQGWMLKKFAFMGYQLEKSDPEDIQYSIDYRSLEKGEKEEYFELFQMAGWSHVCSDYDIHIFKAATGTQPIYSDPDSTVDKVSRLAKPIYSIAGFLVLFFIFSLFFEIYFNRHHLPDRTVFPFHLDRSLSTYYYDAYFDTL